MHMLDDPTPAASTAATLRLHPDSLATLRGLDPTGGNAFVERVLRTYLGSLDRHLEAVQQALALDDASAVRSVAHTLKSSSQSIGAQDFGAACAALERRMLELQTQGAAPARAEIEAFMGLAAEVRRAVQLELGGPAS